MEVLQLTFELTIFCAHATKLKIGFKVLLSLVVFISAMQLRMVASITKYQFLHYISLICVDNSELLTVCIWLIK